ncbi:pyridoxal phosphate-dependent transferase [Aspergillus keveii]|uniref:Pyridoxal phosphate-dependent transferase n=1 Tax=Aspergillus keveii TaxID=714993 RepID=A0ABR4G5W4_9EURO
MVDTAGPSITFPICSASGGLSLRRGSTAITAHCHAFTSILFKTAQSHCHTYLGRSLLIPPPCLDQSVLFLYNASVETQRQTAPRQRPSACPAREPPTLFDSPGVGHGMSPRSDEGYQRPVKGLSSGVRSDYKRGSGREARETARGVRSTWRSISPLHKRSRGKCDARSSGRRPSLQDHLDDIYQFPCRDIPRSYPGLFAQWFYPSTYQHLRPQNGYASLYDDFESFYTRRMKQRINDCFERPTTGVPGRHIVLLDRATEDNVRFQLIGTATTTLNLSSYNYRGFAQSEGPCADAVEETIRRDGISMAGPYQVSTKLHLEVEEQIARFLRKEAAMVFSIGFAANSTLVPSLVESGCLVLSDELNHASIRFGARLSGAAIEVFAHNNTTSLENKLREAISQGQPRRHRPWQKILVTVEGLFSMEGTMCNLPRILELKKKYKFYLFIDEAHSIGAIGSQGRGVCDYFKADPAEVNTLMGTFTKSFGANGGYVAASKEIIDKLRCTNAGQVHGEAPALPILAQISCSHRLAADGDPQHLDKGKERLQRLSRSTRGISGWA